MNRLRFCIASLLPVHDPEIVQASCNVGMIGSECSFLNCEAAVGHELRCGIFAALPEVARAVVCEAPGRQKRAIGWQLIQTRASMRQEPFALRPHRNRIFGGKSDVRNPDRAVTPRTSALALEIPCRESHEPVHAVGLRTLRKG